MDDVNTIEHSSIYPVIQSSLNRRPGSQRDWLSFGFQAAKVLIYVAHGTNEERHSSKTSLEIAAVPAGAQPA